MSLLPAWAALPIGCGALCLPANLAALHLRLPRASTIPLATTHSSPAPPAPQNNTTHQHNPRKRSPYGGGGGGDTNGTIITGGSFSFLAACSVPPCSGYQWSCDVRDSNGDIVSPEPITGSEEQLTLTSGAGAGYDVDMALVDTYRTVDCVVTFDGADGPQSQSYLLRVDPAPPLCTTTGMTEPKALRAKADVCKGRNTRQIGQYQTVYVPSFTDPQGFPVTIVTTEVTTNQLTANCNSCTAAQRRRERLGRKRAGDPSCTCLPAAEINGDNSVCVLPDVASGRGKDGRVYRIYYTATVAETGLDCQGVAKLCVGGRAVSQRKNPTGDNVNDQAGWQALAAKAGRVGAQCFDVKSARGATKGRSVGVQCAPNPARLQCTEQDADQWYQATDATCTVAGRRKDVRKAKQLAGKAPPAPGGGIVSKAPPAGGGGAGGGKPPVAPKPGAQTAKEEAEAKKAAAAAAREAKKAELERKRAERQAVLAKRAAEKQAKKAAAEKAAAEKKAAQAAAKKAKADAQAAAKAARAKAKQQARQQQARAG